MSERDCTALYSGVASTKGPGESPYNSWVLKDTEGRMEEPVLRTALRKIKRHRTLLSEEQKD